MRSRPTDSRRKKARREPGFFACLELQATAATWLPCSQRSYFFFAGAFFLATAFFAFAFLTTFLAGAFFAAFLTANLLPRLFDFLALFLPTAAFLATAFPPFAPAFFFAAYFFAAFLATTFFAAAFLAGAFLAAFFAGAFFFAALRGAGFDAGFA